MTIRHYGSMVIFILLLFTELSPAQNCPKDEDTAVAEDSSRKCRKSCVGDFQCDMSETCNCDDLCGMSCFDPETVCPYIGKPANGSISYKYGIDYNSIASYFCDRGFYLSGHRERKCRSGGVWSHSNNIPNCTKGCSPPETHLSSGYIASGYYYGSHYQEGYPVGHVVTYECLSDYEGTGNDKRTCQRDYSWTNLELICRKKLCGSPSNINNGNYSMDTQVLGGRALYRCNRGYYIRGTSVFQCTSTGIWDPSDSLPTCEQGCLPPETNLGSSFITSGLLHHEAGYPVGHMVTYMCEAGFEGIGNGERICQSDYSWTNLRLECEKKLCGRPSNISNGYYEMNSQRFQGTVHYKCNKGYSIRGTTLFSCWHLDFVGWFPRKPLPTCEKIRCSAPSSPENGIHIGGINGTYGDSVIYQCNAGYALNGPREGRCNENGTWGEMPTCTVVAELSLAQRCPKDEDAVIAEDSSRNCKESCAEYLHCESILETCNCDDFCGLSCFDQETLCPYLGSKIPNGSIAYSPNRLAYNSVASYFCNSGFYLSGQKERKCRSGGEWSHSNNIAKCIKGCSAPEPYINSSYVTSGYYYGSHYQVGYPVGHIVTYECLPGYEGTGDGERTCQSDYSWTNLQLLCRKELCGPPSDMSNGHYDMDTQLLGGTVRYKCNKGYNIRGNATCRCMSTGTWEPSGPWPTCEPIRCILPTPPAFGRHTGGTRSTYGDSVTYKCDTGYTLKGPTEGRCNENGTWGHVPTCQLVRCSYLGKLAHGNITLSEGNRYGSVATYSCDRGFYVQGWPGVSIDHQRECGSQGMWIPSHHPIKCKRGCLPPEETNEMSIEKRNENVGYRIGYKVHYSCSEGYIASGNPVRTCQSNYTWSDLQLICKRWHCGNPPPISNGLYHISISSVSQTVRYRCFRGYRIQGQASLFCGRNNLWQPKDSWPTCTKL